MKKSPNFQFRLQLSWEEKRTRNKVFYTSSSRTIYKFFWHENQLKRLCSPSELKKRLY